MAKVNNLKRLVKEDFPPEHQELAGLIAFSLNPLLEQITGAFNKNIDFDNLNQEVITVQTEVDASNIPKVALEIAIGLKTRLKGCQVISADNLSDTTLLNGAPFIEYSTLPGGVKVKKISGLVPNKKYRLNILFIG